MNRHGRQHQREEVLKFDLLVNCCLLVEIKAVEKVHPIHKAQLLSYMKLLDVPLGLLINFHVEKLTEGVSRVMLPNANLAPWFHPFPARRLEQF